MLYSFFHRIGKLKDTYRFSTIPTLRDRESSADHSWRLAVMVFMAADELGLKIDVLRAVKLALIHDLPEAINGDIDARLLHEGKVSKEKKNRDEEDALRKLIEGLPQEHADEIYGLWDEYEHDRTQEARFVKALDKIEGLMQLWEADGVRHDVPELLGTYGNDSVRKVPELLPMFRQLKSELKSACIEAGFEWKEAYDI